MKYLQKIILWTCIGTMVATLCACGRYSEPSPIEGSGYPHNYPHSEEEFNG